MHGALSAPTFACRFSGGWLEGAARSVPLLVSQARTNRIVSPQYESKEIIMIDTIFGASSNLVTGLGGIITSLLGSLQSIFNDIAGLF